MKKQVLVIHGAGAFASLDRGNFIASLNGHKVDLKRFRRGSGDWKMHLEERLGEEYEILAPKMPDADNPQYKAWKIWFEKILAELNDEIIIVGHSLGGVFLLKYFSEEKTSKTIRGLFAVAAPFFDFSDKYEKRGFSFTDDTPTIENIDQLFLYYSKDDAIVTFEHGEKMKKALPNATFRELDGRGHFNKDDFPEIVEDIKSL